MPNALAGSLSPYLRQHADNPVDWHAWPPETLALAAETDRPLLISIGYAACHWCHVMAHESFEDPAVAAIMNEHFVCIKVDREERPDLDAIYIDACQAMTGHAGWPLNAFATPDGRPFYTGTYFPPTPGRGLPAWTQLLQAVADAWRERREELEQQGDQIAQALVGAAGLEPADALPGEELLERAAEDLRGGFDSVHGGFGGAPKFPPSTLLAFLLRRGELAMARATLRAMIGGGIFDQGGGGFSRYSVDATWTVPHFEKMLYDNALLARRCLEGARACEDPVMLRAGERTLDWIVRDLQLESGAFAGPLDGDPGGVEGSYYVWTPEQLTEVLGDDAQAAARWFGVTADGNFEDGATVLEDRGPDPALQQRGRILSTLSEARNQRVWPERDDKAVVSWNALTIHALADGAIALERPDLLAAATRCADVLLAARDERGRVPRVLGGAAGGGVLDDTTFLIEALVALYEAGFETRFLIAARELADVLLRDFSDDQRGGFFTTARDQEQLIARRKEVDDNPVPSGQASAALGLLRLHSLTGEPR